MITKKQISHKKEIASQFIKMCAQGDLPGVQKILKRKAMVGMIDFRNMNSLDPKTRLVMACEKGHLDVVKYITSSQEIKEHSDVNFEKYMYNPLAASSENNHFDIVKYLISSKELKKTVNLDDFGAEAFDKAINKGYFDIGLYIFEQKSVQDSKNIDLLFKNLLTKCIKYNRLDLIHLLLNKYQNTDEYISKYNLSLLNYSISIGSFESFQFFYDRLIQKNEMETYFFELIKYSVEKNRFNILEFLINTNDIPNYVLKYFKNNNNLEHAEVINKCLILCEKKKLDDLILKNSNTTENKEIFKI